MKKNRLVRFTKHLIDFMFFTGKKKKIVVVIGVPFIFRFAERFIHFMEEYYYPFVGLFMIAGGFALAILWELRNMFKTVISGNPFVRENVKSLQRMGVYAFIIAALMAVRLVFIITAAALVIVAVFLIAGLFSMVLSQVFDQAVTYKQENDLTI